MELEGGGGADPPQVVGGKSERLSRARARSEKKQWKCRSGGRAIRCHDYWGLPTEGCQMNYEERQSIAGREGKGRHGIDPTTLWSMRAQSVLLHSTTTSHFHGRGHGSISTRMMMHGHGTTQQHVVRAAHAHAQMSAALSV